MAERAIAGAKALVESAAAEEEQLDLLEPVTPEDMALAQEELGPRAGNLTVLRHARAAKAGRRPGSRNKRTDDFARYIGQFGQDPAITLMQIQATATEVLVERSRLIDPPKRRLSYGDAQSLRVRCAEALMPFIHSKKPVAVDLSLTGVSDLIIEGVTHSRAEIADIVDAEFLPLDDDGSGE